MSEVFPNKNPILFGDPEDSIAIIDEAAIAGLSGDVILAESTPQSKKSDAGTSSAAQSEVPALNSPGGASFVRLTFSNVTTPANSVMIFYLACGTFQTRASEGSKNWLLQRNGITIDSFSLLAGSDDSKADVELFIEINPPAGTFTYTVVEDDGAFFGGIQAKITFIQLTDTHIGVIATPATAIKQINSPDTHTTRQTEVIP